MRSFRTLLLPALLLLAGCRSAEPPTITPGQPTPPATASPEAPIQTATAEEERSILLDASDIDGLAITFKHPWTGERGEQIDALVARFNKDNAFGITVTPEPGQNLFEEVSQSLQDRAGPNVTVGFNYHVLAWRSRAELPDLEDFLSDPVWGLDDVETESMFNTFFDSSSVDGARSGLPFYRTAEVLLYNTTWAGELGFSNPPATPDELRLQACAANTALRDLSSGSYTPEGGLVLTYEPVALVAWMTAFNGGYGKITADEAYAFDRAQNIESFIFLRGLLDDGCAWTSEDAYPHADFAARRALFLPATLAGMPAQQAAMDAAGNSDAWTAIPYPAISGEPAALVYGPDLVLLPGEPEEVLAAWVFIKWLADPQNSAEWFEQSGYFPARKSGPAGPLLQTMPWLPDGIPLPPVASWPYVQWVVSDTARVLFAPLITTEDAEAIASQLDLLAEELTTMNP